jgi:hypothetical protein
MFIYIYILRFSKKALTTYYILISASIYFDHCCHLSIITLTYQAPSFKSIKADICDKFSFLRYIIGLLIFNRINFTFKLDKENVIKLYLCISKFGKIVMCHILCNYIMPICRISSTVFRNSIGIRIPNSDLIIGNDLHTVIQF